MHTEYLILGQGLAGSLLATELEKLGRDFVIIDNDYRHSSSLIAAGTINPITGRNYVKTWKADELWPALDESYKLVGDKLGKSVIRALPILRSLHSIKEENAWLGRLHDPAYSAYIQDHGQAGNVLDFIQKPFGLGEISGSRQLNIKELLPLLRMEWEKENKFLLDEFDFGSLEKTSKGWQYKGIHAENLVCCEGHQVYKNPYFKHLGFDPVKGEALIIELEETFEKSLRDKTFITPLGNGNLHWCGAGYSWQDLSDTPTSKAREEIESQLKNILRIPFKVVDHLAGIRPATKYRRPFAGKHETINNLFIFNGLGTKGSSLGPFFARQMALYLCQSGELDSEILPR